MLTSLKYPDFRLVWLGSLTEHFGESMQVVSLLWLTNELTNSPLMLTIVGACQGIPMIVFPIIGGVAADRINRRNLLIMALLGAILLSLALIFLVINNMLAIWHIITIALLSGVATSFNHPARQSIVPNLIKREHLLNAISLDTFSVMSVRALAMPITGYLIVALGYWPIFAMRVAGAAITVLLVALIKTPLYPPGNPEENVIKNLRAGFSYLHANMLIMLLLVIYLVPTLIDRTVGNLLPVVAKSILDVGAIGYGYLEGAQGLGAVVALLALAALSYSRAKIPLMAGTGIILGIALLGFAASRLVFPSLALLVIIGGMNTALMALSTTLIQESIPNEMRGRIMSWREIAMGISPVISILLGMVAQNTSVPMAIAVLGAGGLVLSGWLFTFAYRERRSGNEV